MGNLVKALSPNAAGSHEVAGPATSAPAGAVTRPSNRASLLVVLNQFATLLVGWLCWETTPSYLLIPWLVFMTGTNGLSLLLGPGRLVMGTDIRRVLHLQRMFITLVTGFGWSIGLVLLLPLQPQTAVFQFSIIVGAIIIVSAPLLPSHLATSFIGALVAPLAMWSLFGGPGFSLIQTIALLAIALFAVIGAKKLRAPLHRFIQQLYSRRAASPGKIQKHPPQRRGYGVDAAECTSRNTLDAILEGIISTDLNGVITYMNPVAQAYLGISLKNAHGRQLQQVFNVVDTAMFEQARDPVGICRMTSTAVSSDEDLLMIRQDGKQFHIEYTAFPIQSQNGEFRGIVLVFRDTGSESEHGKQNYIRDPLTGLINQSELIERIAKLQQRSENPDPQHAVCFIQIVDLDDIARSYGTLAKSQLLQALAKYLRLYVRAADTLARLNDDKFAVLFHGCEIGKAKSLSEELKSALQKFQFEFEGETICINPALGLVRVDQHVDDIYDIIETGNNACRSAIRTGNIRIFLYDENEFFISQLSGKLPSRDTYSDEESYRLVYLTSKNLSKIRRTSYVETLLRMTHEGSERLLTPSRFFSEIENRNLLPHVDRWVINTVAEALWSEHPAIKNAIVGLNVSAQSLCNAEYVTHVEELFDYKTLPAQQICFELKETEIFAYRAESLDFAEQMRHRGALIAIDSFGLSPLSFHLLKTFPVNFVKLAPELIANLTIDKINYEIMLSLARIAKHLHIQTIAKCVTEYSTLQILRNMGVDYAQGFSVRGPQPLFSNKLPRLEGNDDVIKPPQALHYS